MPNIAPERRIVHVAVGVIINDSDEVLVALRPDRLHQGGLWEFPGGKVEPGETVFAALQREFLEEVSLYISTAEPFMSVAHDYGDKEVLLDVWQSRNFSGEAAGREGQLITWAGRDLLASLDFPEGNRPILEKLLELL